MDVDACRAIHDEVSENVVHHGLEGCGTVCETKIITRGSNNPWLVRNAAFHLLPSFIRTSLYPHLTSNLMKYWVPLLLGEKDQRGHQGVGRADLSSCEIFLNEGVKLLLFMPCERVDFTVLGG